MSIQETTADHEHRARIAPRWFSLSAAATPPGILGQFMLAGLSLFVDGALWGMHGALGSLLALPIGVVAIAPLFRGDVRPLRHWAGLLGILYLGQVVLAVAGTPSMQALHVFNAGLLLATSLVIAAKVARTRWRSARADS